VKFDEYANKFETVKFERKDGILVMRLCSDVGSYVLDDTSHRELGPAFRAVADDVENRVVILTGTGDTFWATADFTSFHWLNTPKGWDRVTLEGKTILTSLLDINVPIICAVNGPAIVHAEVPLLADIIIASDTAEFGDRVHTVDGIVPGDGVHIVWLKVLGVNRGRYLLLTGKTLNAEEALAQGVISEVLPADRLMARAFEIAEVLNQKPLPMLRQIGNVLRAELRRAVASDLLPGLNAEAHAALSGADGRLISHGVEAEPVPLADRQIHDFITNEDRPRYPQLSKNRSSNQ
jgi:enoyl-CoA hydratase/carnithine racemase